MDGAIIVVVKALYGLNSDGVSFHKHLSNKPRDWFVFQSFLSDQYKWIKSSAKYSGFKYYKYNFTHRNV